MDVKEMNEGYPTVLELDGVYVRVERNGKWVNRCFSDLTKAEQDNFLSTLNTEGLKRLCQHLSDVLRNNQKTDNATDPLFKLMSRRGELTKIAIDSYKPQIATVCHLLESGEGVSEKEIERLCDGLLDYCYDNEVVELFKQLLRAAGEKYPQLVQDYVRYFKDQWGGE